jgi:hypothetical protein
MPRVLEAAVLERNRVALSAQLTLLLYCSARLLPPGKLKADFQKWQVFSRREIPSHHYDAATNRENAMLCEACRRVLRRRLVDLRSTRSAGSGSATPMERKHLGIQRSGPSWVRRQGCHCLALFAGSLSWLCLGECAVHYPQHLPANG